MHLAYLLIGSNLGDRKANLDKCRALLGTEAGCVLVASDIFETEPWGTTGQAWHLNQALLLETHLSPLSLLERTQAIERELGREKTGKWSPRTLDVDIIYFDRLVMDGPRLAIPHPLMQERRFVLVPLAQIAPDYLHPVLGKSNLELLKACLDVSLVRTPGELVL